MSERFEDYQWLITPKAEPWLSETFGRRESGESFLRISKWLRKQFTPQRSALILELVQNRSRAIRKFERAEQMFFTRTALEMATDQWIAGYKSRRYRNFRSVADICCSIGGDLIALASAQKSGKCTGFDNEKLAIVYANANLESHGLTNASAIQKSLEEIEVNHYDAFHVDPDRRKNGRSTRGNSFSPSLDDVFEKLSQVEALGIKVAPATPAVANLSGEMEREWIGRRRECQQQMIWSGDLANHPGCRVATRLGKSGSVTSFALLESDIESATVPIATSIQQYVYEPHSVLLASGLADALASQLDLEKVAPDVFYFTSDSRIKNRLLSRFKVAHSMKANLRSVTQSVQDAGYGDLEVKKRGITEAVAEKYKRIQLKGLGRGTLLLCPFAGQVTAIIASRESSA